MAEYIEREAFIDRYRKLLCEDCDRRKGMKNGKMRFCYEIGEAPCRACSVDDMLSYVDDFPAADVQPVRHGRWQITDAWPHNVYCSECHKRFAQTHWAVWEDGSLPRAYCPNFGAKMDTEEREVAYDPDKFFGRK